VSDLRHGAAPAGLADEVEIVSRVDERRSDVDLGAELEREWFRFRHLVEPPDEAGVRR
jgi:hypothetical protein